MHEIKRMPGFIYSACGTFIKHSERVKKIKKPEIQNIFIKANKIKPTLGMI